MLWQLTLLLSWTLLCACITPNVSSPNIIVFLADDFGYGDLSIYGHPSQEFGAIDQLAVEGMRFTQFYSVATFCTPSRASLLTGRYPQRSGMMGNEWVHLPCHHVGLPHEEYTIAEALKDQGYATGMVGKWHLGINKYTHYDGYYLPHNQGFDYVGTMLPHTLVWDCDNSKRHRKEQKLTKCFAYYNQTISQQPIKLEKLTSSLLEDTKAFLHTNHDKPFFFYMSFGQTHTPMHGMERLHKKSRRGLYGDQVNEMAWAVGEVMETLKLLGIDDNTLTIFTSDHGPHRELCSEGGSTGGFKGGKGNFNEGGVRIPAIMRWPGVIPAHSTSHSVLTLMDLMPTLVDLVGGSVPDDTVIDGRSFASIIRPLENVTGIHEVSDPIHDVVLFYCMDGNLMAARYEQYKIHYRYVNPNLDVAVRINCQGGSPKEDYYHATCEGSEEVGEPIIYNLLKDPYEMMPLPYRRHKNKSKEAWKLHRQLQKTLKDAPAPQLQRSKRWGESNCKREYIPCCNPPYCYC